MSGRANYRWTPSFVTKTSAQIAPGGSQSMVSIENDYSGADFSASLKAMNPSVLDDGLTGIYVGSYLQSITPRLALGLEGVWQRAGMKQGPELLLSYAAKYKGNNWIASAQLLAQGGLQGTYWRRLTDKVEAGVDMNLYFAGIGLAGAGGLMGGFPRSEGVATFGAKYDFTASTYRAQVDSQGRVACLLEKRVAPSVQFTFSGEIDHSKVSGTPFLILQDHITDRVAEPSQAWSWCLYRSCRGRDHGSARDYDFNNRVTAAPHLIRIS